MRWNSVVFITDVFRRCHPGFLSVLQNSRYIATGHLCCPTSQIYRTPAKHNFLISPYYVNLLPIRGYAKGKDKRKEKKGKKKVEINETMLGEIIEVENMKTQMQKAVDNLKDEYIKNLSLRSTTGAIESLKVHFEEKNYTLQELAQVIRKNPKTVILDVSAFPQSIPAVLQSIQKSGMNLNPQQDGTTLFIPVPVVTKEYRENLAKNAKMLFIRCRDNLKDVQNRYIKKVKNLANISEDELNLAQDQIIAFAEQYLLEAMKIHEAKESELLG